MPKLCRRQNRINADFDPTTAVFRNPKRRTGAEHKQLVMRPFLLFYSIFILFVKWFYKEYIDTMLMRIRTLLSDSRMKTITSCSDDLTLEKWLETCI